MERILLKCEYEDKDGVIRIWYDEPTSFRRYDLKFLGYLYDDDNNIIGVHMYKRDTGNYEDSCPAEYFDLFFDDKKYSYPNYYLEEEGPTEWTSHYLGEYNYSLVKVDFPGVDFIKLNTGAFIPTIGYGTWLINNDVAKECVSNALKAGYYHIDSAKAYGNEDNVGNAIKESNLDRSFIYLTTKVPAERKTVESAKEAIDESLELLKTHYIDLMLIHCPMPWNEYRIEGGYRYEKENVEVYKLLEEYYYNGKIISIGVSNFNIDDLKNILANCRVKPAVNQIPVHIGNTNMELINFCLENDIQVEAYSPLAHGRILNHPEVIKIAKKYKVSVPQLCIKYTLQLGCISLPKASSLEHMKENLKLDFTISYEDMEFLKTIKE